MGWRDRAEVLKLPSDLKGRAALLALASGRAKGPVDVRITALNGNAVRLRPGTTDFENLVEGLIAGYAQPPREAVVDHVLLALVQRDPRVGEDQAPHAPEVAGRKMEFRVHVRDFVLER